MRAVDEAASSYQRQARALAGLLEQDVVESQALLERKIRALQAYTLTGFAPQSFTAPPPTQVVSDVFFAGMALAGLGLVTAGIAAVQWLARSVQQALGDVGEDLTARLLKQQDGWQEAPFDQPKHGFDRVFTAPGLPLIIVESKVNRQGEFHPGQPQVGEQGSPAWIAAQAEHMADPNSAQWSPDNARIAALIQELGPEHIPVVAVVITTETGAAQIFYRKPGEAAWHLLQDGIALVDVLGGVAQSDADEEPESPALGPQMPPESKEGNLGGPGTARVNRRQYREEAGLFRKSPASDRR